jgi:hypothetical protein
MEHSEGEASHWDRQHNTIFYGWGYTVGLKPPLLYSTHSQARNSRASRQEDSTAL